MRYSEILKPWVLLTLGTVLCVGLVWHVMASSGSRDGPPALQRGPSSALRQIGRSVVVTGRIQPVASNRAEEAHIVAITVAGVGTYRIADSGKGRDLRNHVGHTVRVVATTRLDSHGKEVLQVEDYAFRGS